MRRRVRTTALALLVLAAATTLPRAERYTSEPRPSLRSPDVTRTRVPPPTPTPTPATTRQIATQDRLTPLQRRRDRAALARRRLIEHLPITLAGIRIDIAGIAADRRRTLLELDPGPHSRRFARTAYRQALRTFDDSGRAYELRWTR